MKCEFCHQVNEDREADFLMQAEDGDFGQKFVPGTMYGVCVSCRKELIEDTNYDDSFALRAMDAKPI